MIYIMEDFCTPACDLLHNNLQSLFSAQEQKLFFFPILESVIIPAAYSKWVEKDYMKILLYRK